MIYNDGSTSTLYYYVLNAQGDVIALLNSAGALVAPTTMARGATIPCMVLTAKRPRMPASSGTSTPCVTAAITTTPRPASTMCPVVITIPSLFVGSALSPTYIWGGFDSGAGLIGYVVINKTGQVITAYTSKYFDANMQKIVERLYGK